MKLNQSVLILILSTNDYRYRMFKDAIAETWMRSMENEGIPCYFYEGGGCGESVEINGTLYLDVDDRLPFTYEKFIKAVNWALKKHPETTLIYRTNLSSYIEVNNFIKFIKKNKFNEYSYAGFPGVARYWRERFYKFKYLYALLGMFKVGREINFASGSGVFIGVEILTPLLKDNNFNRVVDDVEIRYQLAQDPNINNTPPRIEFQQDGSHIMANEKYLELINKEYLFHYRFKTKNRENDVNLIRKFHDPEMRLKICTFQNFIE